MTPEQFLREMKDASSRGFLPGLLLAFISFLRELAATEGKFKSLAQFYDVYPQRTTTRSGGSANTLIVDRVVLDKKGKLTPSTLSIRKFYDQAESWIYGQKRFDYPNMAPHATQAWDRYEHWLEALLAYDTASLDKLEAAAKQYVLDKYPSQDIDPTTIIKEPRRFHLFVRDFELKARAKEKSGAAYQGTVFGYVRADAPHLQVDVDRVRTGSKRVGRIGDIDARDGGALVITAEVKQFHLGMDDVKDLAGFANDVSRHKALGMIVALDFQEGVREQLIDMGLEPISRADLGKLVRLWDPLKQRIAVQALIYFVQYKEKNSVLLARINEFFAAIGGEDALEAGPEAAAPEKPKLDAGPAVLPVARAARRARRTGKAKSQ